jgi:5'-AMP-activated protein kinase regulatory beta subunit
MGNAGGRERSKSGDAGHPSSPTIKEDIAFDFTKKTPLSVQTSYDDEDTSYYSRDKESSGYHMSHTRPRSNTVNIVPRQQSAEDKLLPTVFKWSGGGHEVLISGSFTDWKPIPMAKSKAGASGEGDFIIILELQEGEHQYKYLVDGEWKHNANEPTVDNNMGTKNNIIDVKKTDFEVFEALAIDSDTVSHGRKGSVSGSPPGDYSQDIPNVKPWEKPSCPPILPPHLLQVILNKDTPLSCEPTLLPEPNHVMLNHLYALSIKDGVMVLSATHRYRKKYVTTLLYKPI